METEPESITQKIEKLEEAKRKLDAQERVFNVISSYYEKAIASTDSIEEKIELKSQYVSELSHMVDLIKISGPIGIVSSTDGDSAKRQVEYTPAENMQFSIDNAVALKEKHGDFVDKFFALGRDTFQWAYLHVMPQLPKEEQQEYDAKIARNTEMNLRQNAWKRFPKQTVPLEGYSLKLHPSLEEKAKQIQIEFKEDFPQFYDKEYETPFEVFIVDKHKNPMGVVSNLLWNHMKIGLSINVREDNIARMAYDLGVYHSFNEWQENISIDPSDPKQIEAKYALNEGMKKYATFSQIQYFDE